MVDGRQFPNRLNGRPFYFAVTSKDVNWKNVAHDTKKTENYATARVVAKKDARSSV
jgi:hypothetical protein